MLTPILPNNIKVKVKKEIFTAAVIGIIVGLVLTGVFIVYRSRNLTSPTPLYNPLVEDYPQQNGIRIKFSDGKAHQVSLQSPIDQAVVNSQKVDVIGQTSPDSVVVVLGENSEKTILADGSGNFETSVNLINGENDIIVKSFSPSGLPTEKTVTVVVSAFEY